MSPTLTADESPLGVTTALLVSETVGAAAGSVAVAVQSAGQPGSGELLGGAMVAVLDSVPVVPLGTVPVTV